MSQPALEVTGSQEVGSSHSQLTVPLTPLAEVPDPLVVLPEELPQAAMAETATTATAAAAVWWARRDLSRPRGRERGMDFKATPDFRAHGARRGGHQGR